MSTKLPRASLFLYYGLPVAGLAFFGAIALIRHRTLFAGLTITFCGLIVVGEGLGLVLNWRGGTNAFHERLRRDERNTLLYAYPKWGLKVGGAVIVFIGVVLVGEGIARIVG